MSHHRGTESTEGSSDRRTHHIVGSALAVHRTLGPGLLETAYETCRLDLVVEGKVVIEVKSISRVLPIHRAQLLTYLKLTGLPLGLVINFNVEMLRDGIHRIINE